MSLPPDTPPKSPPRFVPTLTERIRLVKAAESADEAAESSVPQVSADTSSTLRTPLDQQQAVAEHAARPEAAAPQDSNQSFAQRMAALRTTHAAMPKVVQQPLRAEPLRTSNAMASSFVPQHPPDRDFSRENSPAGSARMDPRTEPMTSAKHMNEIGDPVDHAGSDAAADSQASARSLTVQQASDFQEMLAHRVLQRVDIALEQQLHKAIGAVVKAHSASLLPKLRDEIESVVSRAVNDAVSVELACQSKHIEGLS